MREENVRIYNALQRMYDKYRLELYNLSFKGNKKKLKETQKKLEEIVEELEQLQEEGL